MCTGLVDGGSILEANHGTSVSHVLRQRTAWAGIAWGVGAARHHPSSLLHLVPLPTSLCHVGYGDPVP
eukprot:3057067-Rhodomonas_salina.7